MDTSPLVPDSRALRLEQVSVARGEAVILVSSARPVGYCPLCGRPAARVHSRYQRTLQDLSWQGTQVTIRWQSRKFFCDAPGCPQRIFTEQVPTVTWRYGRRTTRAREVVRCLGLTLGGEAGRRVAKQLHLPVSGDTLLREVRRMAWPEHPPPRVVGVDDWALSRGQKYGTVIVDLERHQPLDLLPDRNWETLGQWLAAHPSVAVVSRDRADCYACGATVGAPRAIQVADRWHLLKNLREALQHAAERFATEIERAAQALAAVTPSSPAEPPAAPAEPPQPRDAPCQSANSTREIKRCRRRQRYERVKQLHAQGMSLRNIAQTLRLNRKTVCRFLRATQFPERIVPARRGSVTPFLRDLQRLWIEDCHNARTLTRELQRLGYRGSYFSVRRAVAPWRHSHRRGTNTARDQPRPAAPVPKVPSARQVAWLLFLDPQELETAEQRMAQAIQDQCPPLGLASELAKEFTTLFKQHRGEDLAAWIERATAEAVPVDVRRFAQDLRTDLPAIQAAATLPWSNGQTEGQINRLKLTKREMYGRAKLDLLRKRFVIKSGVG